MGVKKGKDYSAQVLSLVETLRRVSQAHNVALDTILHDIELTLVTDDNFTRETYLGQYVTIGYPTKPRLTIPGIVNPAPGYHIYITEWSDMICRPIYPQRKTVNNPIIEVP